MCNGLLPIACVTAEYACRGKLAEFVSNHIFRYINRNELVSVVNCNCMTYEIRRNHRSTRPCLDYGFFTAFIHVEHFFLEFQVDIWSFFQ